MSQSDRLEPLRGNPLVSKADIPPRRRKVHELRFRLWGEKLRSLPFARRKSPWGTPPFPTEPSSAAVSSFAALRMRHTPCGYLRWASAGTPIRGTYGVRHSSFFFLLFFRLPGKGSCQRPEPLTEGFPKQLRACRTFRAARPFISSSVPEGHLYRPLGAISLGDSRISHCEAIFHPEQGFHCP